MVGAHTKVRLGKLPFILFAKFKKLDNAGDSNVHQGRFDSRGLLLIGDFLLCDLSALALR